MLMYGTEKHVCRNMSFQTLSGGIQLLESAYFWKKWPGNATSKSQLWCINTEKWLP